jgi:hypothetical protein
MRSDEELRRASVCVDDDLRKMGHTLQLLLESKVTIASPVRDQVLSNALLDSFLQATRNLCHFLYSSKPRPSDIVAENFFDDGGIWARLRPDVPELRSGSLASLISKRIAHLTWDRASETAPSWGAFRIAWELGRTMEVFTKEVLPSRIDQSISQDNTMMMFLMRKTIAEYGEVDLVKLSPLSQIWKMSKTQM